MESECEWAKGEILKMEKLQSYKKMGAEKGFRFVGCLTPAGQVTWRGNDSSDASSGPGTVHVSCTGRCFCLIIKFVSCLCSSFSQGDPYGLWPGWFRPSPDQPLTHRPHLLQPILSQLELEKEQRTGRYGLKGIGFQTYKMKRYGDGWWWQLHNNATVFYITELYT